MESDLPLLGRASRILKKEQESCFCYMFSSSIPHIPCIVFLWPRRVFYAKPRYRFLAPNLSGAARLFAARASHLGNSLWWLHHVGRVAWDSRGNHQKLGFGTTEFTSELGGGKALWPLGAKWGSEYCRNGEQLGATHSFSTCFNQIMAGISLIDRTDPQDSWVVRIKDGWYTPKILNMLALLLFAWTLFACKFPLFQFALFVG